MGLEIPVRKAGEPTLEMIARGIAGQAVFLAYAKSREETRRLLSRFTFVAVPATNLIIPALALIFGFQCLEKTLIPVVG